MSTRVRNPEKALVRTAQRFSKEPREAFAKLQRIGEQEGYLFILDAFAPLEIIHKDTPDVYTMLTVLRMPEWEIYDVESETPLYCFGIQESSGFVPRGLYCPYRDGRGYFTMQYSGESLRGKAEKHPFKEYVPKRLRSMIYKKGLSYFIVKAGNTLDFLLAGYLPSDLTLTRGRGYLGKRYQAYVKLEGPFKAKDRVRTHFQNFINKEGTMSTPDNSG
jgi:hypothetical protein